MLANETIIKTVPKEQRCTQLQVIHDIGFVKIPKKTTMATYLSCFDL